MFWKHIVGIGGVVRLPVITTKERLLIPLGIKFWVLRSIRSNFLFGERGQKTHEILTSIC